MTVVITLGSGKVVRIDAEEFPVIVEWNGKQYEILITKNGKLIMV
jgi:hemin uptake protein HemP